MTNKKAPGNVKIINNDKTMKNAEIEFPVTFELKAVMESSDSDDNNKKKLTDVFKDLATNYSYIGNKKSSKGTYVSYNFKVTLENKPQLEKLYSDLKNVPGLKFAL